MADPDGVAVRSCLGWTIALEEEPGTWVAWDAPCGHPRAPCQLQVRTRTGAATQDFMIDPVFDCCDCDDLGVPSRITLNADGTGRVTTPPSQ